MVRDEQTLHSSSRFATVVHNVSFDPASKVKGIGGWTPLSLHVTVNRMSSHRRHRTWNQWKKKRETEKVQGVEAVEAISSRVQGRDKSSQDTETAEKPTNGGCQSYQSEMDWNGNENDDEGHKNWESLTPANSLVDVARLHCNIEWEQDKASALMPDCFFLPGPNSDPTASTTDSDHISLADFPTYCPTYVHTAHKVYSTTLPTFLSRCPHPVPFSSVHS